MYSEKDALLSLGESAPSSPNVPLVQPLDQVEILFFLWDFKTEVFFKLKYWIFKTMKYFSIIPSILIYIYFFVSLIKI